MNYTKGILSGFAAIVIVQIACSCFFPGKAFPNSTGGGTTATDPSGFLKMFTHNLHSPQFWLTTAFLFWVFFVASRSNTFVRVCFFWIPTVTVSTLTLTFAVLWTYLSIHFRNQ